jgi:CRP/FNR family cyclic AMP-dependent transcriptional regulator
MAIELVHLLDVDPDLGAGLGEHETHVARAALVSEADRLPKGAWSPVRDGEHYGALILGGLVLREMTVAGRPSAELLGVGDVLLPLGADPVTFVGRAVSWRTLSPTRIAWLGSTLLAGFVHWPGVARTLLQRSERRVARVLAMQSLAHLPRVEDRLLGILWLLAERWGRVGPDGVLLPLPLTHRTLGQLVGAERSTVTTAFGALQLAGSLERLDDEGWLLCGECPPLLQESGGPRGAQQDGAPPSGAVG